MSFARVRNEMYEFRGRCGNGITANFDAGDSFSKAGGGSADQEMSSNVWSSKIQ